MRPRASALTVTCGGEGGVRGARLPLLGLKLRLDEHDDVPAQAQHPAHRRHHLHDRHPREVNSHTGEVNSHSGAAIYPSGRGEDSQPQRVDSQPQR
eukprot:475708-Prorocentrum_minimum.AAC.1